MSFAQRLFLGIALAASICTASLYYAWQEVEKLTASLTDDSRQERIITASEKLLSQFITMETSARSYLITGAEEDLQPFSRNVGEVALSLRELRSVSQPLSPERASALDFLDTAIDKKVNETNYALILRREQGIKISAFELIKYKKLNIADTITQVIRTITSEEVAASKKRIKSIPDEYRGLMPPVLMGLGGASFVLIAFGVWAAFAQKSALKPIVEGAEKIALGDVRHRISTKATRDVQPIISALNSLGEQLQMRQGVERKTEDIFADIFHTVQEPTAVWRARRNGLGQIIDYECVLANAAFGSVYQHSAEALKGVLFSNSRFADLHSLNDAVRASVEKQQPFHGLHTLKGKQYRISAVKIRDGFLLRLMEV